MSLHGLKKLWRAVHQRALLAMPGLFDARSANTGTRGPEKRRALLQYLRQHPEDLRPYQPSEQPSHQPPRQSPTGHATR